MHTSPSSATPVQLASLRKLGHHPAVLDVSTIDEYRAGHVEGACLIPLGELDPRILRGLIGMAGVGRFETLYLVCHSGARARQAAERLLGAGFYNLALVEGGPLEWEQAGLPVVRRKPFRVLDGQAQISIGVLLLIPFVLGLAIHDWFFVAIPLIGIGLILSGATRWSGMAKLLALMPWNRPGRCLRESLV